jgi:hypothetical protein
MKSAKQVGILLFFIGLGLFFPLHGFCAGYIIVYASDACVFGSPPPATTAILDETVSQAFGTNHWICFPDVAAGTHTVAVTCATSGYLRRESPSVSNAVNDPTSDYGNPRQVQVADNESISACFLFDPVVTVSAVVRDAWTMARLENAAIELIINSGASSNMACYKYPWIATYATDWRSGAEGQFPSNTFLYATESCDLRVTQSGYQTFTSNNIVTNAAPGDVFNLEELFLLPVDNNTNLIADAWETLHFGSGSNVPADADADADGICNRDEYIAGTDPNNPLSRLGLTFLFNGNELELKWNTESWRTYRIRGTTCLTTGSWVQVGGTWEATNGQFEMGWTETNLDLSWNSNYQVEVVPCTWQETNQVLVNTNQIFIGGSGGSDTNYLPPLP